VCGNVTTSLLGNTPQLLATYTSHKQVPVWDRHSSRILGSAKWELLTDVSVNPIGTIFKDPCKWGRRVVPCVISHLLCGGGLKTRLGRFMFLSITQLTTESMHVPNYNTYSLALIILTISNCWSYRL